MSVLDGLLSPAAWLMRRGSVRARLLGLFVLLWVPMLVLAIAWVHSSTSDMAWPLMLALGVVQLVFFTAAYRSLGAGVDALVRTAGNTARGDLSQAVVVPGHDELAAIGRDLEFMSENFAGLVGTIRNQAVHVALAGESLGAGMHDLSQRTEAQAASLEQASASIAGLSESVQSTARRALEVDALTRRVQGQTETAEQAMDQTVQAITAIEDSSKRMGDIVSVIDGLAFQTNILALNAAVEAARAGESGRGFAVVASEVRTLAQRSAASAREIRSLIASSAEQVSQGVTRIGTVTGSLHSVVQGIHAVANGLGDITTASNDQSTTLAEIAQAVGELDNITQRNGAMVDQALQATLGLRDRASSLSNAVSAIKLRRGTADEAHALVQRAHGAIQQLGLASAASRFHDPQGGFRDRDLYIFMFDRQGVYQVFGSTPANVGKRVHDIRGLDGDHIIREGFAAAERGGGWIDYEVVNPVTDQVDEKTSFILPVGQDRLVGCGVFKPKGGFKLQAATG